MSASISNPVTNQQQLFQAAQNAPKANAIPSLAVQQAPSVVTGAKAAIESASHKNNDGTFGPKHTFKSPSSAGAVAKTAVNVEV